MRKVLIVVLTCLMNLGLIGQQAPPQGINYQATLYVPSTKPLPGTNGLTQVPANKSSVEVVFTIEEGMNGPVVFQENHQDTTDELGLLELIIGQGSPTVSSFNQIDWSLGDLYLRVSITILTTNTTINSYQKLWSVPYSLYSARSNTTGYSDSSGHSNTSDTSLYSHNSGHSNTSDTSLYSHNSGHSNTSDTSLYSHNSGHSNTSDTSLYSHNSGHSNTSDTSLYSHNSGHSNTSDTSLYSHNSGHSNTSDTSLYSHNSGHSNTSDTSLYSHNSGHSNTSDTSLYSHNSGHSNTSDTSLYSHNSGHAQVADTALNAWRLTGNSGTTPNTNFIGTTDTQDWVIKTNNIERMRVMANGNVGIGESNPSFPLHVNGTIYTRGKLEFGSILGLSSFPTSQLHSSIWSTSAVSTIPPFNQTSNLIFQTSSQLGRDIWFVTGITPRERLVIKGSNSSTHDVLINNTLYITPRNSPPTNPVQGYMYFDSVINKLRVFDGTSWQNCW